MSEASRAAILDRLRSGRERVIPGVARNLGGRVMAEEKNFSPSPTHPHSGLARLRSMMEAVKTEFLEASAESWPDVVRAFLTHEGVKTLLYGAETDLAPELEAAFASGQPRLVAYDRPIEEWKAELFGSIDAAITTTRGGIADTGSLILWPSPAEPRLMSLVPPIHVALLDPGAIYESFADAIRAESWAAGMPPNALLISGPSKTADIEQTLAYGVHGPKRLIVVVVQA